MGHPRAGRRRDAVRLADRALPDLGRHRRGHRRAPPRSARWAGWPRPAARRQPTTTTSSRTPAATCSAPPSTAARTIGLRFHPTRGSMDLGRSQGGLPPDHVVEDIDAILQRQRRRRSTAPRPGARLDAADRPGALLAVLGDRRPVARVGRAGPRATASGCTPTCARRRTRRPTASSISACGRSTTPSRSAGSGRTCGSPTPYISPTPTSPRWRRPARRSRTARRPTPGSGRASPGPRDLRDAGVDVGLGVDGVGLQRGRVAARGGAPLAAVRPGPRRPGGADRHGRAGDGDDGRRPGDRAGPTRSARSRSASRPTSRCGGWTPWPTTTSTTRSPALVLGSPPPLELLLVQGRPVVERDRLVAVDEAEVARDVRGRSRHPDRPSRSGAPDMPLMFLNGTGMAGQATHWIVGDSPLVARPRPRRATGSTPSAAPTRRSRTSGRRRGASVVGEVYDVSYAAVPRGAAAGRAGRARARRDRAGRRHRVVRHDPAPRARRAGTSSPTSARSGSWRDYQTQQRSPASRKRPDSDQQRPDATTATVARPTSGRCPTWRSARSAAVCVWANDELFAERENLIKPEAAGPRPVDLRPQGQGVRRVGDPAPARARLRRGAGPARRSRRRCTASSSTRRSSRATTRRRSRSTRPASPATRRSRSCRTRPTWEPIVPRTKVEGHAAERVRDRPRAGAGPTSGCGCSPTAASPGCGCTARRCPTRSCSTSAASTWPRWRTAAGSSAAPTSSTARPTT